MLKPSILHTRNTRAILLKSFQKCSNVDVVFPTCHNILETLQRRFAEVRLRFCCRMRAGIKLKSVKQSTGLVKVWP